MPLLREAQSLMRTY